MKTDPDKQVRDGCVMLGCGIFILLFLPVVVVLIGGLIGGLGSLFGH